eukprot:TRINITY_DN2616_c0_g1_i3.p1 TRINITY_DN2616_c0_g1~~TRINITY_DN2616_c0_g1_i3.p1  ORF type:complete len:799 (-),score=194.87 TRINITY_DN2616_c0_g1_i3:125-2521(-)
MSASSQIIGFVEELVVDDDPEYSWADTFKSSRFSNEQRQTLLYRLSGKLRRKVAMKVLEMNGNAVLCYHQDFDLEKEVGIIARAYGTCCRCVFSHTVLPLPVPELSKSPDKLTPPLYEAPYVEPMGFLPLTADDVALLTLKVFPTYVPLRLGGVVLARSIKLLKKNKIHKRRDKWWLEIREEIRSHARTLGCNYVIGYEESTSIYEDVCVISASGTACKIKQAKLIRTDTSDLSSSVEIKEEMKAPDDKKEEKYEKREKKTEKEDKGFDKKRKKEKRKKKSKKHSNNRAIKREDKHVEEKCLYSHLPYKTNRMVLCHMCKQKFVPEIIMTTIEPLPGLGIVGRGSFIQARVCQHRKKQDGEQGALAVSQMIPFLEFELHKQLNNKLRVRQMNAIFGLKFQLEVGQYFVVAVASGTAYYLKSLPLPLPINFRSDDKSTSSITPLQKKITELAEHNLESLIRSGGGSVDEFEETLLNSGAGGMSLRNSVEETASALASDPDLFSPNPDTDISAIRNTAAFSDVENEKEPESMELLLENAVPSGVVLTTVETTPANVSLTSGTIVQVINRIQWSPSVDHLNRELSALFESLYSRIIFKVREMAPCVVCGLNLEIMMDDDDIQFSLVAMALCESDSECSRSQRIEREEGLFHMEVRSDLHHDREKITIPGIEEASQKPEPTHHGPNPGATRHQEMPRVCLTPLSYVCNAVTEKYLGRINIHFIKERNTSKEKGGLRRFVHVFLSEVNHIARSHVAALNGNALLGYKLEEFLITESGQNQSYCLVSLSGDAAFVRYYDDPLLS